MRHRVTSLTTLFALAAGTMLSLPVWAATNTTWVDDPDRAVAKCLYAAYMEFAWRYEAERDIDEMKRNSDVSLDSLVRILEDRQEQARLLYRFFVAAQTIVDAQLMPPGEREAMIDKAFYFPPEIEGEIETYLEKVCPTLEAGSGVWNSIVVPFARDLGISEDSSAQLDCLH